MEIPASMAPDAFTPSYHSFQHSLNGCGRGAPHPHDRSLKVTAQNRLIYSETYRVARVDKRGMSLPDIGGNENPRPLLAASSRCCQHQKTQSSGPFAGLRPPGWAALFGVRAPSRAEGPNLLFRQSAIICNSTCSSRRLLARHCRPAAR